MNRCSFPWKPFCCLVLLLVLPFTVRGDGHKLLAVGKFSSASLDGWESKIFKGETSYGFVLDGGRQVLKAESKGSASGYFHKLSVDPRAYPLLRWSWKIAHTVVGENARSKGGDDFAARVYVVFPRILFWQSRSIVYAWSGSLNKGETVASPYTDRVMIVAVESGNDRAGKWVGEERNYLADYRRFFGEEPGKLGAVAVMTDTDNTGGEARAWYGDIFLTSE